MVKFTDAEYERQRAANRDGDLEQRVEELEAENTALRELLDDVYHSSQKLENTPGWMCFPDGERIIERIVEKLGTENEEGTKTND